MTDETFRAHERGWRASGSLEDEIAWLGERRRREDLDDGHLAVCARMGHPAASALIGERSVPGTIEELKELCQELAALGRRPVSLAMLSLLRLNTASLPEDEQQRYLDLAEGLVAQGTPIPQSVLTTPPRPSHSLPYTILASLHSLHEGSGLEPWRDLWIKCGQVTAAYPERIRRLVSSWCDTLCPQLLGTDQR